MPISRHSGALVSLPRLLCSVHVPRTQALPVRRSDYPNYALAADTAKVE
jgi:hypothetical protein